MAGCNQVSIKLHLRKSKALAGFDGKTIINPINSLGRGWKTFGPETRRQSHPGPSQNAKGPRMDNELPADATGDALYFMVAENRYVKIGRTKNIPQRLRMMQCHCPLEIWLAGHIDGAGWSERVWHHAFSESRGRGEWFNSSKELKTVVTAAIAGEDWISLLGPNDGQTEQDRQNSVRRMHARLRTDNAAILRELARAAMGVV